MIWLGCQAAVPCVVAEGHASMHVSVAAGQAILRRARVMFFGAWLIEPEVALGQVDESHNNICICLSVEPVTGRELRRRRTGYC